MKNFTCWFLQIELQLKAQVWAWQVFSGMLATLRNLLLYTLWLSIISSHIPELYLGIKNRAWFRVLGLLLATPAVVLSAVRGKINFKIAFYFWVTFWWWCHFWVFPGGDITPLCCQCPHVPPTPARFQLLHGNPRPDWGSWEPLQAPIDYSDASHVDLPALGAKGRGNVMWCSRNSLNLYGFYHKVLGNSYSIVQCCDITSMYSPRPPFYNHVR